MDNEFINSSAPSTPEPPASQDTPAAPPPDPDKPDRKKMFAFQKDVNRTTGGLLLYFGVMNAVVIVYMIVRAVLMAVNGETDQQAITETLLDEATSGGAMLLAVAVGTAVNFLYYRKRPPVKELYRTYKPMKAGTFLQLLAAAGSLQALFGILSSLVEILLNSFGYSIAQATESASGNSSTLVFGLYIVFGAPLAEEHMFRGFLQQNFRRHGKLFAIVFTAILFGILHANPIQTIYAAFVGIVLGYAAIEYGLVWSILLHIVNNFIFGILVSTLSSRLPENAAAVYSGAIVLVFFIAGIAVLITKRGFIADYIRENRTPKHTYGPAFSTVCTIIFIVINVLAMISQVQPLGTDAS